MAHIINQKYTNAIPLYRQEQEFKRYAIQLVLPASILSEKFW
ncbi:IS66 family transposase [Cellulosilyticum ruminicola]